MQRSRDEPDRSVDEVKSSADSLMKLVKGNAKLSSIKGSDEFIQQVQQLVSELEICEERLRKTVRISALVSSNLVSLGASIKNVLKFLDALSHKTMLFFTMSKLRAKLQNHQHMLRSKLTLLITSVTLELLDLQPAPTSPAPLPQQPVERRSPSPPPSPIIVSKPVIVSLTPDADKDLHTKSRPSAPPFISESLIPGVSSYYGIAHTPKNLIVAYEKFKVASESPINDAEAMVMMAECLREGHGVECNEYESQQWLDRAVAMGSARAMHRKAMIVLKSLELKNAAHLYDVLATFASFSRGWHHNKNNNCSADSDDDDDDDDNDDSSQAAAAAAGGGSVFALTSNEKSTAVTTAAAAHRQQRSHSLADADQDSIVSELNARHEIDQIQLQEAVQLLFKSAERGCIDAKADLGILYELSGDLNNAFEWFKLASDDGCPRALNRLGLLYFHGKGATLDREKAFSLFTFAAKAGDRDANNNAGICLEQGLGTEMRIEGALSYYKRGAALGSPQAMYSLGYLMVRSAMKRLHKISSEMRRLAVRGLLMSEATSRERERERRLSYEYRAKNTTSTGAGAIIIAGGGGGTAGSGSGDRKHITSGDREMESVSMGAMARRLSISSRDSRDSKGSDATGASREQKRDSADATVRRGRADATNEDDVHNQHNQSELDHAHARAMSAARNGRTESHPKPPLPPRRPLSYDASRAREGHIELRPDSPSPLRLGGHHGHDGHERSNTKGASRSAVDDDVSVLSDTQSNHHRSRDRGHPHGSRIQGRRGSGMDATFEDEDPNLYNNDENDNDNGDEEGGGESEATRRRREVQIVLEEAKEGRKWLRSAAEAGVVEARYQLGRIYQQGMACTLDIHAALMNFEEAADAGHVKAAVLAAEILYTMAGQSSSSLLSPSPSTSKPVRHSHGHSHGNSSNYSGGSSRGTYQSPDPSPANTTASIDFWMNYHNNDSNNSTNNDSSHSDYRYLLSTVSGGSGVGVSEYVKSAHYYKIAAVGGSVDAMNALGLLLEDGRGCANGRPSPVTAAGWYMQCVMVCLEQIPTSPAHRRNSDIDNDSYSHLHKHSPAHSHNNNNNNNRIPQSSREPSAYDLVLQEALVNLTLLITSGSVPEFPSVTDRNVTYTAEEVQEFVSSLLGKHSISHGHQGHQGHTRSHHRDGISDSQGDAGYRDGQDDDDDDAQDNEDRSITHSVLSSAAAVSASRRIAWTPIMKRRLVAVLDSANKDSK